VIFGLPAWMVRGGAFVFGLLWGSFLNVVIYRLPLGLSVVSPPSHCPACKKPVRAYDNIPIVSYLVLLGKARCCGARMSPRYVIVELIGGILSVGVLEIVVSRTPSSAPEWMFLAAFLSELALCLGLVAAAFIDWEHMILPDEITLGGAILGLATTAVRGGEWIDVVASSAGAYALVWFLFNFLYKKLRGRTGMGMGDAKLLALAGAWFGWRGVCFALFAGAIQGSVGSIVLRLVKGKIELPEAVKAEVAEMKRLAEEGDEEAKEALLHDPAAEAHDGFMQAAIPFGPFLILGMLEYLFFGPQVMPRVIRFLVTPWG
jgi:leader peptidase (prepilin peptidase)/N-methyltransferase